MTIRVTGKALIDVVGLNTVDLPDGRSSPYVNLDNAATTPAATEVFRVVEAFLETYGSVHRGSGLKSVISTAIYEGAADFIRRFVGADDEDLVIVAGNTTQAINRLARCYGFERGDIVLISEMEHTSNDLPWRQHATVMRVRSTSAGTVDLEDLEESLRRFGRKVRLVALTGASNVTGYLPPIRQAARIAHSYGVEVFVDCAQLVAHRPLCMRSVAGDEDLDYVAFSGHKMYAPFGAGVVVGRKKAFERLPPDLPGGGTVDMVTIDGQIWTSVKGRLDAGTPNGVGLVAMASAMKMIEEIGFNTIRRHENDLVSAGLRVLNSIQGVRLHGQAAFQNGEDRLPVFPFTVDDYPDGLIAAVLGREYGIAVRHGHLCQHEFMRRELKVGPQQFQRIIKQVERGDKSSMYGMVRASCGLCTTIDDLEALGEALRSLLARGPQCKYTLDAATGNYISQDEFEILLKAVAAPLRFLVRSADNSRLCKEDET